jgi:Protein of unknown function (DUF2924)
MKKRRNKGALIAQSLEMVSKEVFKKYSSLITDLVERSSGVYALYDDGELYYVGRATTLRTRVRQHLFDRHGSSWTHFSLFLIGNDEHIGEIESLLIRIADPKGNSVKPKGIDSRKLQRLLEQMIKQKHREELDGLFSKRNSKAAQKSVEQRDLKGMVTKRTPIFRNHKGKDYTAYLTKTGIITHKGKSYKSPSGAAKAIANIDRVNGWRFWYIKNRNGEWVKLCDYK